MKKVIYFSLITVSLLQSAEELNEINITEKRITTEVIADVYGEELKSSDLAEALSQTTPSINMIRRSGVANDIVFRGQKRDNINVVVDGMKVFGACSNRMDPPTSHIMTQNIDSVEITEGGFDVEDFGTLSGKVSLSTREPSDEFKGEVNLNVGSYAYKKATFSASGGNKNLKVLFSASAEEGGQYHDGNGDNFSEQLANQVEGTPLAGMEYLPDRVNQDAYERKSVMGKIFWNLSDDQALKLSYTANRSKNILYPSTPMDADFDDSDLYNLGYSINNLSELSKKLEFQLYQTEVEHPMSIRNRKSSLKNGTVKHALTTQMKGAKIKNSLRLGTHNVVVGLDKSQRNWNGLYFKNEKLFPLEKRHSIHNVDTDNQAFFIKDKTVIGSTTLESGIRVDDTKITHGGLAPSNSYRGVTGNVFATFKANNDLKYYVGLGKSTRVPDARELYYVNKEGKEIGTPNLDETTNYEADIGLEKSFDAGSVKTKLFYSQLKNYIYYNGVKKGGHNFTNIDATLYGAEVSGHYLATDSIIFDYALVYNVGKKDSLPEGHSDRDLADITPLKLRLAMNYDFDRAVAKMEWVGCDNWEKIDSDNGEQKIAGYSVINLTLDAEITESFNLTLGVENLLDKTYTVSNTQKDLTLVGGDKTMLMNEPGRYFYLNANYSF